ncbi:MAG: cytochrome P460 family protein [Azospirillaceae bacterium]
MIESRGHLAAIAGAALLVGCAGALAQGSVTEASRSETTPPFSGPENVAYADAVWSAMTEARMAGAGAVVTYPYTGREPHGLVLEYLEATLTINGQEHWTITKRNHVGEDVSIEGVINAPEARLDSVTVMVKREAGYDPDHQDWWWAKYNPDGTLQTNPNGMALAGRVAKGADVGCIACHQAAPGGDYIYSHDRGPAM